MAHGELAGYTLLAGYACLLLGAIRAYGLRRVLMVVFGILFVGIWLALGTFRGLTTGRR